MAAQESYRSPCSGHGSRNGCAVYRDKGFYDHYQIGGGGKPAEAEAEPEESEGGLTTRYVGSHSPFGIVWQLSAATGWTVRHVLWGVNYQTLRMMLADAPHYETIRHKKITNREAVKIVLHKAKEHSGIFPVHAEKGQ